MKKVYYLAHFREDGKVLFWVNDGNGDKYWSVWSNLAIPFKTVKNAEKYIKTLKTKAIAIIPVYNTKWLEFHSI